MENISVNPLEVTTTLVNEPVRDLSQQPKLIVYSRRNGPKRKRLDEGVDNSVVTTISQGNGGVSYEESPTLSSEGSGKTAEQVPFRKMSFPSGTSSENFLGLEALPNQPQPQPASNRRILNTVARQRVNNNRIQEVVNPSRVPPRTETYLAPDLEPVNKSRSYEDEITTLWPKNQDGTLLSFTELLLNRARRDEVALLQETQHSLFSSAMEPRGNTASPIENSSTCPPNHQTQKSFSFTKFLFDEGDGSGYQEAFTEWMNSR